MNTDSVYELTVLVSSSAVKDLEASGVTIAAKKLMGADLWDIFVLEDCAVKEDHRHMLTKEALDKFRELQTQYYSKVIKKDLA